LRPGQEEEAEHREDEGAGRLRVGDHPLAREMHRVEDDVGNQGGDRDHDQRADRLAAFDPLGAKESPLGCGVRKALEEGADHRARRLGATPPGVHFSVMPDLIRHPSSYWRLPKEADPGSSPG
jgi:hypothetical protein